MKHIKLFESFTDDEIISKIKEYEDNNLKYHKSDDLKPSIHTTRIEMDDYDIIYQLVNSFVLYNTTSKMDVTEDESSDDSYDKFQPLNPNEKIHDFHKDDEFKHLFYGDGFTDKDIKVFNRTLRNNRGEDYVLMYHGTSSDLPIEDEGLKRTTNKTKKSLQSTPGFVYLSVFPEMAKSFGELANSYCDITVYQVFIKIKYLKPDKDQLRNKRVFSNVDVTDTLANSLIYGHGARVPRDIEPYEIKKYPM